MTVIEWDKIGERFYQTGVDRGVLYLKDGTAVPWNGLTSVDDGTNSELKSYYLDGVKILNHVTPGEFVGKLSAFTYPEEFDRVVGVTKVANGLSFYEQRPQSFNLSYRTRLGNDLEGKDYGYKIHLLYNLVATPDSHTFESVKIPAVPGEFAWSLTGTPQDTKGFRPTVHVSMDSTKTDPIVLQSVENMLYGTASTAPQFPTIHTVRVLYGEIGALLIVDNSNGTWAAMDPSNDFITMVNATTFQIDGANTVYLDPVTYQISDTDFPI